MTSRASKTSPWVGTVSVIAGVIAATTTLMSSGCGSAPTLPTPMPGILLITPATVFLRPGDSETFWALLSSTPGDDLLPTGARWSVDDERVATVAPDGTVTARQAGHARLFARHGGWVAIHPLEVGDERPEIWSGTYVPTSCTSDCGPCCTMSMKDAMYPRPFRLRFRRFAQRVAGELTLLAGYEGNERSGAFEGLAFGDTMKAPQAYLLHTSIPQDICCVEVRDWTIDARSATGTFIEVHGDPRRPDAAVLTFTSRILGITMGTQPDS